MWYNPSDSVVLYDTNVTITFDDDTPASDVFVNIAVEDEFVSALCAVKLAEFTVDPYGMAPSLAVEADAGFRRMCSGMLMSPGFMSTFLLPLKLSAMLPPINLRWDRQF